MNETAPASESAVTRLRAGPPGSAARLASWVEKPPVETAASACATASKAGTPRAQSAAKPPTVSAA